MTSKMDAAYQSLSRRGYVDSKQDKPPFLDIIADLYHPQSNPGGYVNLGLAENVNI